VTDIIAARDIGKRFVAAVTPLDGLVLLVIGQFRATSKPHTARLRPFPGFRRAFADEVALELGKSA
jgi:hypothetical protein